MSVKISPSLMCIDLMNVKNGIDILSPVSDYFHIDIIDWHYCKNLCLSPQFMSQLREITAVPMEAHLMVDNVDTDIIDLCIESGAETIILPPEIISSRVFRLIRGIKDKGKKVGIYINPGTPLEIILPYAEHIDLLDMMTVDPGYASQKFIPDVLPKIEQARELKEKMGYIYKIEVDGGCGKSTYKQLYSAGADVFVMGSSGLFMPNLDLRSSWNRMCDDFEETTGAKVKKLV